MSTSDAHVTGDPEIRAKAARLIEVAPEVAYLRPTFPGTVALLAGVAMSFFVMGEGEPAEMASRVSRVMLLAIGLSVLSDLQVSLRNLVRVDLFAIVAFYFLALFEFLFEQPDFNRMAYTDPTRTALTVVLLAFAGLALGRHLMRPEKAAMVFLRDIEVPPSVYVLVYFGSFSASVLYMLMAVDFNVFAWFDHMVGPRFTQPWQRAQLGGWKTLINELSLLGLVVPPLAGIIFSRRRDYSGIVLLLVAVVLALQFFLSIAPGTRNALAINLAGFMGGFFLNRERLRLVPVVAWSLVILVFFVVVSDHMLRFREMGLRNYVEHGHYKQDPAEVESFMIESGGFMGGKGYFVDYNLLTIHDLAQVFPDQFGYLGFNVYWVALTKPIPRAIWSGKPQGLAVGIEESLGVEGLTLSCTFAGEAMMAAGLPGVFFTALGLGVLLAYWNRLGCASNSLFALLVYAAGFFAALITMRSLMFATTMILPAIGLIVFAKIFLSDESQRREVVE